MSADQTDQAETPIEWRLHGSYAINFALPVLFGLALLVVGLFLVQMGLAGRSVLFFALSVAYLGWGAFKAVVQNRSRVILTDSSVVNIRPGGSEPIALSTIRAVVVTKPGRLFQQTWSAWLLRDNAEPVRLVAPALVFKSRHMDLAGRPDSAYWEKVALSPSGRQAALVYARARAAQGEGGHLAAGEPVASLLARTRSLRGLHRYWSPNGEAAG